MLFSNIQILFKVLKDHLNYFYTPKIASNYVIGCQRWTANTGAKFKFHQTLHIEFLNIQACLTWLFAIILYYIIDSIDV